MTSRRRRARRRSPVAPLARAVPRRSVTSSSSPAAAPARRSSRTRPLRGRRVHRADAGAGRRRRSAPRGVAAGRRPARPAHRVVVLHRPPSSRRRRPFRLRIRRLPGRARRLPDVLGLASRGDRRSRRPIPVQPAPRGRAARSTARRRGPDGQPTGFDLSLTGADPSRPETQGRPAWSMAGSGGTRPPRRRAGRRRGRAGRLAGAVSGSTSGSPRRSRRPSTTTTAGSTSGPPAGRTTTRGRR